MKIRLMAGLMTLLVAAFPAGATIIGGAVLDIPTSSNDAFNQGGTFIKLNIPLGNPYGAPNSVGDNNFQDPNLYGFDEAQNVTFSTDLSFEYGADTVGNELGDTAAINKNAGVLVGDTGDLYASHYVFFDPGPSTRIAGYVTFDADIVAVFTSTSSLNASDVFINNSVNYLSPGLRGLENKDVPIDVVGNTVFLDFTASTPGDYIRVLTLESPGAVPEASTLAVFATGLFMLVVAGIRRRQLR